MSWLSDKLNAILSKVSRDDTKLDQIYLTAQQNQALLKQIIVLVSPPPATNFTATVTVDGTGEQHMTAKQSAKATADTTINDDGTGTINLTFLDKEGITTGAPAGIAPVFGPASDAAPDGTGSSFVLTPSADGLSCAVAVVNPPPQPLHTGVTFAVTISSGLAGQTDPITVQTDPPLDVVAGPASSFVAAVSEP